MNSTQWKVFFVALASLTNFASLIGAFAMIKGPIANEFTLTEGFLGNQFLTSGAIDGLTFFGRLLGTFFMIVCPSKLPKRDYSIACYLTILFLSVIPFLGLISSFVKPLLVVSMLCSGIFRSYYPIPFIIFSENIDTKKHKKVYNIFSSLIYYGDPLAVIFSYVFMNVWGINWKLTFSFFLLVFFITTTIFLLCLPESKMQ